jgi:hypothetical protein
MKNPKNTTAAINAILDSVEALISDQEKDRGARLRRAEREVKATGSAPLSQGPTQRSNPQQHMAGKSDHLARGQRSMRAQTGLSARNPHPWWKA